MTVSSAPYERKRLEPKNIVGVPRPVPELHPERPQPHIPIPGVPTTGSQGELFRCPICGAVFSSEEELRLHTATDHPKERSTKK